MEGIFAAISEGMERGIFKSKVKTSQGLKCKAKIFSESQRRKALELGQRPVTSPWLNMWSSNIFSCLYLSFRLGNKIFQSKCFKF